MLNHLEYRKYRTVSIVLVIIGLGILILGTEPPLYRAHLLSFDEEHCGLYVRCLDYTVLYQQPIGNGQIIELYGNMTFKSTFLFSIDNPIRYNFNFESKKPELIKTIYFILNSKNDDIVNIYDKNPEEIIDNAKKHKKLITLEKTHDNTFSAKAFWTHPIKEDIVFDVVVIGEDKNAIYLNKTKPLIELEPIQEYFSALEAYNSRVNDQIILGLTWAGIAAIFILLGGDILLRIHLRESKVDDWFESSV